MNLEELKNKQIAQMEAKNRLPKDKVDILLHLVEEVGEVCEAIRENQPREDFEDEVADVLWQLNKLCFVYDIDLEETFLRKLNKNEKRENG